MVIGRQIQEASRRYGSRTVLTTLGTDGGGAAKVTEEFTFAELYDCTLRLVSALASRGLVKGDRLAVLLDNCAAMVISEWACLKTGLLWVTLNTRSSPSELAFMLEDSGPSLLLVGENKLSLLDGVEVPSACELVTVGGRGDGWSALLRSGQTREPVDEPRAEDPVRIRYTSGTAGIPKGAVLPRRCYEASVETVSALLRPMADDEVVLQVAPMTHASGAMLLPHLLLGGRAVLVERFDAIAFEHLVERFRVSSVFLVPTMLVRVLEALERPRALRSLQRIVYGASPMPVDALKRGLEVLGPVFIQIYGLTESTWPVSALSREDHRSALSDEALLARLKSCGKPTAIGEVKVVGEDGCSVGAGLRGEILVRGRNTMLGYWNAFGENARAGERGLDELGWMRTGDIGFFDQDGYLTISDRVYDMIISGGFNVYPREVEDALSAHPAVLEAAVVGRPSEEWGETVHAFVVLKAGANTTTEELIAHCGGVTAAYKKPRSLEFVASLPRNPAGKVLRRVLRARLA